MTVLSNHAFLSQPLYLICRHAQDITQNLISMLTQQWRWYPNTRLRMRVFDGCVDQFHRTASWVVDFFDHIAGQHYRLVSSE